MKVSAGSPRAPETIEVGYDELCGALAAKDLQGLWSLQTRLMPETPLPTTLPWLWRWDTLYALAEKAGRVVTLDRGGDRRVLALVNPGLGGLPFTSTTLWAAIQYLGGRESAPAHRHTPSAIRFVMQGSGAFTTVNGDACSMQAGDLVLTPNWMWHDHTNTGDDPVVWFDGLDLPLVTALESIFFENHPAASQEVVGHDLSQRSLATPGFRDANEAANTARPTLLRYPWEETDRALNELHDSKGGLIISVEYVDPISGRSAAPTFKCEMTRLFPGGRTTTTQKTGSSVYVVYRGSGRSVVGGQVFEWSQGDIFVAPSWAPIDHQASSPVADLFVISDQPVLEALGLFKRRELPAAQPVESTFQPVT